MRTTGFLLLRLNSSFPQLLGAERRTCRGEDGTGRTRPEQTGSELFEALGMCVRGCSVGEAADYHPLQAELH